MEGKGPAADAAPLDCGLSVTLQTRPSDFDREFVIRYSAIADLMQDIRSEKTSRRAPCLRSLTGTRVVDQMAVVGRA